MASESPTKETLTEDRSREEALDKRRDLPTEDDIVERGAGLVPANEQPDQDTDPNRDRHDAVDRAEGLASEQTGITGPQDPAAEAADGVPRPGEGELDPEPSGADVASVERLLDARTLAEIDEGAPGSDLPPVEDPLEAALGGDREVSGQPTMADLASGGAGEAEPPGEDEGLGEPEPTHEQIVAQAKESLAELKGDVDEMSDAVGVPEEEPPDDTGPTHTHVVGGAREPEGPLSALADGVSSLLGFDIAVDAPGGRYYEQNVPEGVTDTGELFTDETLPDDAKTTDDKNEPESPPPPPTEADVESGGGLDAPPSDIGAGVIVEQIVPKQVEFPPGTQDVAPTGGAIFEGRGTGTIDDDPDPSTDDEDGGRDRFQTSDEGENEQDEPVAGDGEASEPTRPIPDGSGDAATDARTAAMIEELTGDLGVVKRDPDGGAIDPSSGDAPGEAEGGSAAPGLSDPPDPEAGHDGGGGRDGLPDAGAGRIDPSEEDDTGPRTGPEDSPANVELDKEPITLTLGDEDDEFSVDDAEAATAELRAELEQRDGPIDPATLDGGPDEPIESAEPAPDHLKDAFRLTEAEHEALGGRTLDRDDGKGTVPHVDQEQHGDPAVDLDDKGAEGNGLDPDPESLFGHPDDGKGTDDAKGTDEAKGTDDPKDPTGQTSEAETSGESGGSGETGKPSSDGEGAEIDASTDFGAPAPEPKDDPGTPTQEPTDNGDDPLEVKPVPTGDAVDATDHTDPHHSGKDDPDSFNDDPYAGDPLDDKSDDVLELDG